MFNFWANNTILFGIPPLKEQNDYMSWNLGGHGSPWLRLWLQYVDFVVL